MFDVTLHAFTYGVEPMPEQHALLYYFAAGVALPAPPGERTPIIPIGNFKFPIAQPMAAEFVKEHEEAFAKVPAPSKLQVVGDSRAAEQMAQQAAQVEQQLRKGDQPAEQ